MTTRSLKPEAAGLYDPRFEHDACGVAMVARLDNAPTYEVVQKALEALDNLEHRGAEGANPNTGEELERTIDEAVKAEGQRVMLWRD